MEKAKQWARVKELFGSALEIEPGERVAFLHAACGEDGALLKEVESLLAADANPDYLSDEPWQDNFLPSPRTPKSIGPFQLVKKLGEGGMGQVWLAEQTAPVRRQVAVKLLRSGLVDSTLLHRFQSECQSLAIMDHPAIAKVYEAGSTDDGQPYLAMEYVPGLPINDYCDEKRLSIRQRLELFIRVCDGVQHAHQKAIMHRDLKPSNLLVAEVDGMHVPRIIDFGLAKATTPQADGRPIFVTQAGGFLGTPGYMSPEQAEPGLQDIDTRTDVYSLGVVLYLLLTGFLPFETKNKPMQEVLRQLREDDPSRPSTRVIQGKRPSTSAAEMRVTEPRQLVNLLHGDLDWMVLKALEKDRNRRYGTPAELASDIRHYLRDEPIIARPASAGYRLQKYVRRHRIGLGVAMGLLLLLATFASVQAVQLRRITRERDRADRITQFISGMFKVSNPSEARGNTITAREILDKASADIDKSLTQDPELQAQMMEVMGQVYGNLGLYGRSRGLLARVVDIRTRVLGINHPQTLSAMDEMGWILNRAGSYQEAEKLQRQTIDLRRRAGGVEQPDTLKSMTNLASTFAMQGHYVEAEKLQRETLEIQRRVLGVEHSDTLSSMSYLGNALYRSGHLKEAEAVQTETLAIQERVLGTEHVDTLRSMSVLANTQLREGRFSESEMLQRKTLDIRRHVQGPEHPDTLVAMGDLAVSIKRQGRYAESEAIEREVLDIEGRVLGAEHPSTLMTMNNLASTLILEKQPAQAENLLRAALAIQQRVLGAEHPETIRSMVNIASCLRREGKCSESAKVGREALEIRRRVLGPEHPDVALSSYNLAIAEQCAGRRDEAFRLLTHAVDHGLTPYNDLGIEKDVDLNPLHGDPRFQNLVSHAKERAAALAKK